jgi:hypothetical protein
MEQYAMISERRETIALRAQFVEMTQLWGFAQQPARRIPEAIVRERMRAYFSWGLWKQWRAPKTHF